MGLRYLSPQVDAALRDVSARLGVEPDWLNRLIDFESGWDPQRIASNPDSTAKGLIQFIDSTAQHLGYENSADLIAREPTIIKQLQGPVYRYLAQFAPFPTAQSLYMSVFYPPARDWPPDQEFSERIQQYNPGIRTVADYVNKVEGRPGLGTVAILAAALLLGVGMYLYLS